MKQEFVDLGLPSGTLWGKRNVYAHKRRHFTHSQAIEVARDLHYKLPAKENFRELINHCEWKWMKLFGKVTGYKVTGPNGNYIFLPAAGHYYGTTRYSGTYGTYWSTTYDDGPNAYYLYFSSDSNGVSNSYRDYGLSVRLVKC